MTFLELTNKVAVRLRERKFAGLAVGYSELAAQIVNEAKREIEDAGPWYALRTKINKSLTPATATVSLTNETNERSYLLYVKNQPQAFVTTVNEEHRLGVIEQAEMDTLRALDPDAQNDVPVWVSFNRSSAGITAEFWPTPDAAYDVRFVMVVPQDDLEDPDDVLSIPEYPVRLLAMAMAMEERGEEFSGSVAAAYQRAGTAKSDAMLSDFLLDDITFEAA